VENISTQQYYLNIRINVKNYMSQDEPTEDPLKEIDEAAKNFDLSKLMRLTGLPADVITGQRVMSRKERRTWYHENRRRLRLPKWDKLDTLIKK
jgi:ssDNA-binding replication factor A large subunit